MNYAVCCYENNNDPKMACQIAKNAFDDAINEIDIENDQYVMNVLQILNENLNHWQSNWQGADLE